MPQEALSSRHTRTTHPMTWAGSEPYTGLPAQCSLEMEKRTPFTDGCDLRMMPIGWRSTSTAHVRQMKRGSTNEWEVRRRCAVIRERSRQGNARTRAQGIMRRLAWVGTPSLSSSRAFSTTGLAAAVAAAAGAGDAARRAGMVRPSTTRASGRRSVLFSRTHARERAESAYTSEIAISGV